MMDSWHQQRYDHIRSVIMEVTGTNLYTWRQWLRDNRLTEINGTSCLLRLDMSVTFHEEALGA